MSTEKNVVGIKFGVLGEGSISGDSGARILRQLTEVVNQINKEPPRFQIKLGIDQDFFKKQVDALSKTVSAKVKNIKITGGTGKGGTANETATQNEVNTVTKHELALRREIAKLKNPDSEYAKALQSELEVYEKIKRQLQETVRLAQEKIDLSKGRSLEADGEITKANYDAYDSWGKGKTAEEYLEIARAIQREKQSDLETAKLLYDEELKRLEVLRQQQEHLKGQDSGGLFHSSDLTNEDGIVENQEMNLGLAKEIQAESERNAAAAQRTADAIAQQVAQNQSNLAALREKITQLENEKRLADETVTSQQQQLDAAKEELSARELTKEQEEEIARIKARADAKKLDSDAKDIVKLNTSMKTSFAGAQAQAEALLERYRDLIRHNKQAAEEADKLRTAMQQDLSKEPREAAEQIRNLAQANKNASGSFSRLTVESDTFFNNLRKSFTSKIFNTLAYAIIGLLVRSLRQVYQNVVKLDTAMTQLRIVTQKSEKTYADFAKTVTKTAKEIGASVEDLIKSTTVFARLGYSIPDSTKFAELATVYSKVAATNIDEASKNITAVIKAFGIGADDLENVLDQFIWIGNNFAITSEEIGIAMNNAASALKANGNTLQESMGILTAANTTLQNINIASTAVRTMAARISRSSAELTELGEDIGNVMSTARLDARMKEFGVSIVDANGGLRSTFDILRDIAKIWDTLGSQDQAAVAEMIAGTRIQNAFYSIMQNWEDAEAIVANQGDAYGSLQKAQEEYMSSIEGKLNQLKASWEEFSMALLDSEIVKLIVDILKTIANVFNAVLTFGDGIIPTIAVITAGVYLLSAVVNKLTAGLIAQAVAHGTLGAAMAFHTKALLTNIAAGLKWMAKNPYVYLVVLIAMAMKAKSKWALIVTVIVAGAIAIGIGIAAGVKIADGAIKSFMASNPIGWILLAITAVIVAIQALVKLVSGPSLDDLKETAKESKEAWEALKSELDEVNSKLKETTDRIEELMELSKKRQLSLVEQQELDKLTEYNAQLKQQQSILEAQERAARDQAAKDAATVVGKVAGKDNLAGGAGFGRGFVSGITLGISDLFGYGAFAEESKQNALGGSGTDEDRVRRLLANWSNTTDEQKKFVNQFISELREQEAQLTYYANATEQWQKDVNAAYNRVWESLDRYTLAATPDGFSTVWNSMLTRERFAPGTNALKDLADAAEVTSDSLRKLYDSNADAKDFIDYLITIGQFSWESSESINALVKSVNDLWTSSLFNIPKLNHLDMIEETQDGFDKLAKSLSDVLSLGVISASSLKDLLEYYEGLDKYFKETSQGFVLGDEFADMSVFEVLERYASDSLQKYVDKLSLAQLQLREVQLTADGTERSNRELELAAEAVANAQENLNTAMETYAVYLRSEAIKEETERLNKQKDLLKEQGDAYKSLIDIRKDLLKTYKKEIDYQKELAQKQKAVADLQTQLSLAKLDTSAAGRAKVRELESQLSEAQASLDEFTLERAIEVLTSQLDEEYKEYQALIDYETNRIVEAIDNLAKDLQINIQELVPDTTDNLWEDKYKDELAAAQAALDKAQAVKDAAKQGVDVAQSDLNTAQSNLDNVSGWDKFWNTKKNKNAKSARDSASSALSYAQDNLSDADRELALAQAEVDRINKLIDEILNGPTRHSGGFVNDAPALKSNEQFAKLLKNEFVATPQQMDAFIKKTLPAIASRAVNGGGGVTIASPLVSLSIANVSKDTLPDVKKIVDDAVNAIKRELDSNFSRTGQRKSVNRFTNNS